MTIQPAIRQTPAEAALTKAYATILGDLPGDGPVMAARDQLVHTLKTRGLPTRRVEAWHYTDLKSLLPSVPERVDIGLRKITAVLEDSPVLAVLNGNAGPFSAISGVDIKPFAKSLADGSAATRLLARDVDDAIGQINGAFVRDGFGLEFAAGYQSHQPIELQVLHSGGQYHSRFPVTFGAGASVTILERHGSNGEGAAFVSSLSDVVLHKGAEVIWVVLQQQAGDDTHLGQMRVELGENARLSLFVIHAGGKLVRQEVHVKVAGEGADFKLRAINLLGRDSHTDVTMTLAHNVPHTTSSQIIRNVVLGRAKGVFQGQICVAPIAQKTDARMACNTLLLSDEAEFSTKPELEIFADDVQCGHGATVADIDHTQLFYLQARGIPEGKARGLLVKGFVAEIVEELENEALVEALEEIISHWLEAHA